MRRSLITVGMFISIALLSACNSTQNICHQYKCSSSYSVLQVVNDPNYGARYHYIVSGLSDNWLEKAEMGEKIGLENTDYSMEELIQKIMEKGWSLIAVNSTPEIQKEQSTTLPITSYHFTK